MAYRRPTLALLLAMVAGGASAAGRADATRLSFDVPAEAVLMGDAMARAGHPLRLATPSEEGQFELLVRKQAAPVRAPRCRGSHLIVRMPATVVLARPPAQQAEARAELARKRAEYDRLLGAWRAGQRLHLDVFAGPYGRRLPGGQVELSGCNLFLAEPHSRGR